MSVTLEEWEGLLNSARTFWPDTPGGEEAAAMWLITWERHRPQDTRAEVMVLLTEAAGRKTFGNTLKPHDLLGVIEELEMAQIPLPAAAFDDLWHFVSRHGVRAYTEGREPLPIRHEVVAKALAAFGGIAAFGRSEQGRDRMMRAWERVYAEAVQAWKRGEREMPKSDFTPVLGAAPARAALAPAQPRELTR